MVEIGVERGRATRPDLKVGVCGEHGGDPASIAFFQRAGLNYVSCSTYRVPVARLAAAHGIEHRTVELERAVLRRDDRRFAMLQVRVVAVQQLGHQPSSVAIVTANTTRAPAAKNAAPNLAIADFVPHLCDFMIALTAKRLDPIRRACKSLCGAFRPHFTIESLKPFVEIGRAHV